MQIGPQTEGGKLSNLQIQVPTADTAASTLADLGISVLMGSLDEQAPLSPQKLLSNALNNAI